jgi:hypothetical protein
MNSPKRWSSLFSYHKEKIDSGICGIYDPSNLNRTFGILLIPSEESQKNLYQVLLKSLTNISEELMEKIFIQASSNIHFSVQWTDKQSLTSRYPRADTPGMLEDKRKVNGKRKKDLIDEIYKIALRMKVIKGELFFPFLGYGNLYGLMKTEQISEFVELRIIIGDIFDQHNLKKGIPEEDYDLVHTSLVRFYQPLSNSEREQLEKIQIQNIEVILDEVVVAFNDKVMSSERTEILFRKKLNEF